MDKSNSISEIMVRLMIERAEKQAEYDAEQKIKNEEENNNGKIQ